MAKLGYNVPGPWDALEDHIRLPMSEKHDFDWDANLKAQIEALGALIEASNKLPDGVLTGYIYMASVADGHAIYRVESTRPLTLAHIPYMDAYHLHPAHLRGLRKADIERARSFSKMWSKAGQKVEV